jgi:hypothetical protein
MGSGYRSGQRARTEVVRTRCGAVPPVIRAGGPLAVLSGGRAGGSYRFFLTYFFGLYDFTYPVPGEPTPVTLS